MDGTLMGIGVACVLAAIVGGGLEAIGAKFPVINSIPRQVLMALFGVGVFTLGWLDLRAHSPETSTMLNQTQGNASAAAGSSTGPAPSPREEINVTGRWNDANGARFELRQTGSTFSLDEASGLDMHGRGEIDGRNILMTYRVGSDQYTCSGALSANSTFITGTCQSTAPGNPTNGFRIFR